MTTYVASAAIKKYRCVSGASSGDVGGPTRVLTIPQSGNPVMRTENGFRLLAAPGIAIGIALEDTSTPGAQVRVADSPGEKVLGEAGEAFERETNLIADSEGRLIAARVGVRHSEPILAIAIEGAKQCGQIVAVKIAPRGLRT